MTSSRFALAPDAADDVPSQTAPAEPLRHYLERRRAAGSRLTAGETVTLVIGLLRGCGDLRDRGAAISWWLTAAGRPVAVDDGDDRTDAIGETLDVLEFIGSLCDAPGVPVATRCREAVAALSPRAWQDVERRAFAVADPEPLVLGPFFPRDPPVSDDEPERSSTLLSLVDADLASSVSQVGRELRHGWLRMPRRRRAVVVGSAIAVVMLAAAIAIPTGRADVDAAGRSASPRPSPTFAVASSASREDDVHAGATHPPSPPQADIGDDPTAIAQNLLSVDLRCRDDDPCRAAVWERTPPATTRIDPTRSTASLVEDFGGLAVVRVDGDDSTDYVTIVRRNDRWLVRDVRTVTDQPS